MLILMYNLSSITDINSICKCNSLGRCLHTAIVVANCLATYSSSCYMTVTLQCLEVGTAEQKKWDLKLCNKLILTEMK